MKKVLKLFGILIVSVLFLTGCTKESNIKEISYKEFITKIENKETFPILIGNDNCSHCISYRPTLEKITKKYNITLYYLDNSKLNEDEQIKLDTIVKISGTPTVAFLTNGEEESTITRIVGENSYENTINHFQINGYIKK